MERREESAGAAERFAAALRELYEAAGSPLVRQLVRQGAAQQPPVKLTATSFSDWLAGKSVPSRPRAVEFLTAFLNGRVTDPGYQRLSSAQWEALRAAAARLAYETPDETARFILPLAADPAVPALERRRAARCLTWLSAAHQEVGTRLLSEMAEDPADPLKRALALKRLSFVDHRHGSRAVETLAELADDPAADARQRRRAAEELAPYGGIQRSTALQVLAELAAGTAGDPLERALALASQARYAPALRGSAVTALEGFVGDRGLSTTHRRRVLSRLAHLGASPRRTAIAELRRMAADGAVSAPERLDAADNLGDLFNTPGPVTAWDLWQGDAGELTGT
ncbi:hypothetical protein ACIBF1_22140 [Spirillospora sp. NPDC050679]